MMKGFVCLAMVVTAVASVAAAAPKPAIVQGPGLWTVEVRFEHPQEILLKVGGKKPIRFWYTIITLTNKTGRDVDFYPRCELMTDTFQIIPAGRAVPAGAAELLKQRHQTKYPFLESLETTSNKLLQGEDNSKDLAIIWPDFDPKAKNIKLFIEGLSNETAVLEHPTATDESGEPVMVFLRKTLELNYAVGGDPALRAQGDLAFETKRWVMR